MPTEPTDRPVRVIVWNCGLDVNAYAELGRSIPHYKPERCPECSRVRTLVSGGLRGRVAWLVDSCLQLFIRRLRCRARDGCGELSRPDFENSFAFWAGKLPPGVFAQDSVKLGLQSFYLDVLHGYITPEEVALILDEMERYDYLEDGDFLLEKHPHHKVKKTDEDQQGNLEANR